MVSTVPQGPAAALTSWPSASTTVTAAAAGYDGPKNASSWGASTSSITKAGAERVRIQRVALPYASCAGPVRRGGAGAPCAG